MATMLPCVRNVSCLLLAACVPTCLPSPPHHQAVFNKMILGLSTLVGLTTTVILFCAHFHQAGCGSRGG